MHGIYEKLLSRPFLFLKALARDPVVFLTSEKGQNNEEDCVLAIAFIIRISGITEVVKLFWSASKERLRSLGCVLAPNCQRQNASLLP